MSGSRKKITISDVAEALNISKTTVSRAISGKGRISENTRQKVMDYIKEHDFKPNVIAKGLAQSRTFNICVVMPESFDLIDMPFFKEAIMGIQEVAESMEYDILLCIAHQNNLQSLERIVSNRKVDGVILLRTFVDDPQIELLKDKGMQFITTGSTHYEDVMQVDFDHESACFELTSILLMKNPGKIALLGGDTQVMANQNRYLGFRRAFKTQGRKLCPELIFAGLESEKQVYEAVDHTLAEGTDCILCMDDSICAKTLRRLRERNISIPQELRIASFHDSSVLSHYEVAISSPEFDSRQMGIVACRNLLAQIEGEQVEKRQLLPYKVVLKESTK